MHFPLKDQQSCVLQPSVLAAAALDVLLVLPRLELAAFRAAAAAPPAASSAGRLPSAAAPTVLLWGGLFVEGANGEVRGEGESDDVELPAVGSVVVPPLTRPGTEGLTEPAGPGELALLLLLLLLDSA